MSIPTEFGGEPEMYVLNKELGSTIEVQMDTSKGSRIIQKYNGSTDEPPVRLYFQTPGPPHCDPLIPDIRESLGERIIGRVRATVRKLLKKYN